MDVGFILALTDRSGDLPEIARTIEALGYESLWIPEHPVIPVGMKTLFPFTPDNKLPDHYARWPDPFIALTVAACATTRIKLGTGICLLPERDVLVTAKAVASLDYYSSGRLLLGVGAGWLREETEVMGANFGSRWKRTRETVEAFRLLWTQREASYQGDLVKFAAVRSEPKPLQKPHPPILLGAHGPKALERVARSYDGWMPIVDSPDQFKRDIATLRALTREQGRDPAKLDLSPFVDPGESGPSLDDLKRFHEAGANRVILFSQQGASAIAEGQALVLARRFAASVERASQIS